MADRSRRERVLELIRQMRSHTVENGCTPAEAANFAAKVVELIEKYQIEEAELRAESGTPEPEIEVVENYLRTGKRVFNPGMTQIVNALAQGMCCRCILFHKNDEAVYGIIGDTVDADYVCQVATTVVPALRTMAALEGAEHGYEKAGLIRWTNQYLTGAAVEIKRRLESERKKRSDAKVANTVGSTALVVTGESLATIKRESVELAFKEKYPHARTTYSRMGYDGTAHQRGREAGKNVGLHVGIKG